MQQEIETARIQREARVAARLAAEAQARQLADQRRLTTMQAQQRAAQSR